jgi:hypothetical protein
MNRSLGCAVAAVLVAAAVAFAHEPASVAQLRKRAELLIPDKSQLRFQEIPWVHDLAEAQQVAQQEKRPMFVWGYGGRARPDNGLEGC